MKNVLIKAAERERERCLQNMHVFRTWDAWWNLQRLGHHNGILSKTRVIRPFHDPTCKEKQVLLLSPDYYRYLRKKSFKVIQKFFWWLLKNKENQKIWWLLRERTPDSKVSQKQCLGREAKTGSRWGYVRRILYPLFLRPENVEAKHSSSTWPDMTMIVAGGGFLRAHWYISVLTPASENGKQCWIQTLISKNLKK